MQRNVKISSNFNLRDKQRGSLDRIDRGVPFAKLEKCIIPPAFTDQLRFCRMLGP